jgi:hypothetical protein
MYGGFFNLSESYNNQQLQDLATQYQQSQFGTSIFRNGNMVPLGIAFVQETTVFRDFGPVAGRTMRLAYDTSPKIGNTLTRQTVSGDIRHYTRLAANGLLAVRIKGQKSWGANPDFMYFGGNSELRGYDYLSFIGHKAFFANAELRFPLIDAMLTPFGVLGGLRGVFFADLGGAGFNGQTFTPWTSKAEVYQALTGYQTDFLGNSRPVYTPVGISGFRLRDTSASYGIGLETSLLGLPMHFDWSYRTLFNRSWENAVFYLQGAQESLSGSDWFRKPKFSFWIGYDF